jgi:benzodiazapine receptor
MANFSGRAERNRDLLALGVFLVVCFAVSALGGAVTASSVGSWYQTLAKPSFNPPDWLFAPVWTLLYVMMAVAGWLVWRRGGPARRAALALFILQLALNLGWSLIFFGAQAIGAALVEIGVLWLAILATLIAFYRIDRRAGLLLAPYLAWVSFATLLTASLWMLN